MSNILSIDPGMRTGLVMASVADEDPVTIHWKAQEDGGLEVLHDEVEFDFYLKDPWLDRVSCELFSPRQMARSYRLEELEPLRIEGYIYGCAGDKTTWRRPEQRHLFNKGDENFKRSQAFLKWVGHWTTGSEVDCEDANDVNSAMMHLYAYLRDHKHTPTIELLLDYNRSVGKKEGAH